MQRKKINEYKVEEMGDNPGFENILSQISSTPQKLLSEYKIMHEILYMINT